MSTAAHHPGDLKAAFMGMAGGLIAVFLVCWGVMQLTNMKFADHVAPGATAAPVQAPGTQPQPATTPATGGAAQTPPPAGDTTGAR